MLNCLELDEYPFTIFQKIYEVNLIIMFGTKLSIDEICIYYMHFVCCNVYILMTMLIIGNILYVFLDETCLECSTQCIFVEVGVECSTICAYVCTS